MADIITNLHPDGDESTNLYPNIKKENIPSKSISTDKLDDNVLSLIGSLKPSGTDTSTNILAFTSNKGIYVATDNGHWYYWNGSVYVDGGVYHSSENIEQLKDAVLGKFDFNIGRRLPGYIDYDSLIWIFSDVKHLNSNDVITFDGNRFTVQLVICDENGNFISNSQNIKTDITISSDGYYAINAFTTGNNITEDELEYSEKSFSIITDIYRKVENLNGYLPDIEKIDVIESNVDELKQEVFKTRIIDATYRIYSYTGTNPNYFHTEPFISDNNITITFSGSYGQISIHEIATERTYDITSGVVLNPGEYQIYGYAKPVAAVTDEKLAQIKSDIIIKTQKSDIDFGKVEKIVMHTAKLVPYMVENTQKLNSKFWDDYEKPQYPIWGHEYLQHWYERVYEGVNTAKVVLDGDSITEGYNPRYDGVDDAFLNMRGYAIKKIMKIGGYPMENLTVINNGHGGRKTGEWVGDPVYGSSSYISQYPNGFLDVAMSHNPDLLIVAWGMNDADKTNNELKDLTTEERIEVFKNHMIEGLERIRGNVSVNGRPAYNKSPSDLSIILCMPTVGGSTATGRGNYLWNQYLREILMELCRKYKCAFADFTFRTYAHDSMSPRIWSSLTATGGRDNIHPNKYSNAQTMSLLQDLIYPVCMWKVDTSDF